MKEEGLGGNLCVLVGISYYYQAGAPGELMIITMTLSWTFSFSYKCCAQNPMITP